MLALETQTRKQAAEPDLELLLAVVKRAPLEWAVEKATELGVRRVRLVTTQRTNSDHVRLERLMLIAIEAAEQTGRLTVPEIASTEPLPRVLETWDVKRSLIFCDETGYGWPMLQETSAEVARLDPDRSRRRVRAGGGNAAQALPWTHPVSLGPRVLRADTAAVAALTLWQAQMGDWRTRLPPSNLTP